MLQIEYTTQFKKDLKLAKRRNKNLNTLKEIMNQIEHEKPLELRLKDHPLTGN